MSIEISSSTYSDAKARAALDEVAALGTVTGDVAVDAATAPIQTLTVGAAGVTDIEPTNLATHQLLISVDNSGEFSFAMPLTTCAGTVYTLGEIPTSGVFDVHLRAVGNDWYATISNDWVI